MKSINAKDKHRQQTIGKESMDELNRKKKQICFQISNKKALKGL